MGESEPTQVARITGGAQGNGEATPDLEVLWTIDDIAFAATRHR